MSEPTTAACESYPKKPHKPAMMFKEYKLSGIDFHVIGDSIYLQLPTTDLPEYNGPVIDRELCDWSREQGISESAFSAAYDKAKTALFEAIEEATAAEFLASKLVKQLN